MKIKNEIEEKDKISVNKKQFEKKLLLEKIIRPKENHKAFEFNTKSL